MADWVRTSPFGKAHGELLEVRSSMVTLTSPSRLEKLKIQCRAPGQLDPTTLERMTGITLPDSPRESTGTAPSVFWTSPGEWLLASPNLNLPVLRKKLDDVMGCTLHAVTDVSDSFAVIELTGARARELLAEGCCVDLDEKQFPVGRYALTRLEQLAVIIHRTRMGSNFRIFVDSQVALYLWDWLEDGASLMA